MLVSQDSEKGNRMSEEQNQERAIIADEQDVEYEIGHLDETQGKEAEEFALKVIKAAASLKMVKIDRGKFLRTELQKHYPEADLDLAVSETPAEAGVPAEVLDTIATEAIDFETKKCSAFSFAAGIPGGLAMAGYGSRRFGPIFRPCYENRAKNSPTFTDGNRFLRTTTKWMTNPSQNSSCCSVS